MGETQRRRDASRGARRGCAATSRTLLYSTLRKARRLLVFASLPPKPVRPPSSVPSAQPSAMSRARAAAAACMRWASPKSCSASKSAGFFSTSTEPCSRSSAIDSSTSARMPFTEAICSCTHISSERTSRSRFWRVSSSSLHVSSRFSSSPPFRNSCMCVREAPLPARPPAARMSVTSTLVSSAASTRSASSCGV